MASIEEVEKEAGLSFLDYQYAALQHRQHMPDPQRVCLYYRTGAGKTYTALGMLRTWDHARAVVIAPPSTHAAWVAAGQRFDVAVECMSHAKFRQAGTKLERNVAVIADEFHLFGGHSGKGWKKFSTMARGLKAPIVMCSATPNYNDAERVYCIQYILDPLSCKGGFLNFLYQHCTTEANPFAMMPNVTGFRNFASAAEYLAALPGVDYLPDDLVYSIDDVPYYTMLDGEFEVFGYVAEKHRLVASLMEERHSRTYLQLVNKDGFIHDHVMELVLDLIHEASTPVLIYSDHATIAEALARTMEEAGMKWLLVTGKTTKPVKQELVEKFISGACDVLIGTAALATGTDGMDKVCDRLIILDDTNDDALRRQLIGRIMPRGTDTDASKKQVFRLVHS